MLRSILNTANCRSEKAWNGVIDNLLTPWLRDPSQLADDGVTPPTPTILRMAIDHAEKLRDQQYPEPTSIVADPNGGVVFEWRSGHDCRQVTVWEDGTVEYLQFEDTRLVDRGPLLL